MLTELERKPTRLSCRSDSVQNQSDSTHQSFIKERKLKTFSTAANSAIVTEQAKESKQVIADRNIFGQLVLLAVDHNINLEQGLTGSELSTGSSHLPSGNWFSDKDGQFCTSTTPRRKYFNCRKALPGLQHVHH